MTTIRNPRSKKVSQGIVAGRASAGRGPLEEITPQKLAAMLKPHLGLSGTQASGGSGAIPVTNPGLTDGHIFVGNASNVATDVAMSGDVAIGDTGATTIQPGAVTETKLGLSDNTTANASTSAHGLLKKLDGNSAHFLDGTGAWSAPSGGNIQTLLDGIGNVQGDILYRSGSAWSVLAPGTAGYVLTTGGASANPAWSPASAVTTAVDADLDNMFFGAGTDGDVTISSGTTTLTRDMFYHNLTISGTGKLNLAGFRCYVAGTLDLTAAPAAAIVCTHPTNSLNGNNGSTFTGTGASGGSTSVGNNTVGAGQNGGNGGNGTTGAGAQAANVTGTGTAQISNTPGTSGKGGSVGATAGGAARAGNNGNGAYDVRKLTDQLWVMKSGTAAYIQAGVGAPGGGGGAGDGTGTGGSSGGGGATPGIVWVGARTIARSGSTGARCINADAGNGGNGAAGTGGTNTGGGGGGAGAPGGWAYVIYRFLTGSSATALISATGGNGGNGGNGRGTGGGGDGGGAGARGRIDLYCLADGTWTHADADTATVAGGAASGTTGGTGATANTQYLTL